MSSLLVCGTSSDAGKSVIVAGLCRYLSERGIKVAPFKAQNMSLNSAVTPAGDEIGRAQAAQAFAAGIEPEAAMNPILLKPATDTRAQVVVMGHPHKTTDAVSYQALKSQLMRVVLDAFESLRSRFDVIVCEGAGSLAEFNLRDRDLVNLGFARETGTPIVVVADIDRGGSFAALYGSLALLEGVDQQLVSGFVMNKFRGDVSLLDEGLARFAAVTRRPFYGVLPWVRDLAIDAEDSLAIDSYRFRQAPGDALRVAVVRLRAMSNFTDFEPLSLEPCVSVKFTEFATDIIDSDLVIIPGSKSTVADLTLIRECGLDDAIRRRAQEGRPILGMCAGYQMLGRTIIDRVESDAGEVCGLELLPVITEFASDKHLARRAGRSRLLGTDCDGYEIHHGRPRVLSGQPMFETPDGPEGCIQGPIWGTSWHGIFESDAFRKAMISWVAGANGRDWSPGEFSFPAAREAQATLLGVLVSEHLDCDGLMSLARNGAPQNLPVIAPAGVP